jgi:hypothetical protein
MDPLRVYALPVSGGALVAQLAFLIEIAHARRTMDSNPANIYPDIVLGASGGNVAAYVATAGGWTPHGILRVSSVLETSMLITSWWPEHLRFMPTFLLGIFTGSLYRPGYGVRDFFNHTLNPKKLRSVEIWTGTFNITRGRAQFFCNKKDGETHIKAEKFERDRLAYNCEPLVFANGNLNLLADVAIASASIPVLVESQVIGPYRYCDGGSAYASPLSVMAPEILRITLGQGARSPNSVAAAVDCEAKDMDSFIKNRRRHHVAREAKHSEYLRAPGKKYSLQLIYFSCYSMSTPDNSLYIESRGLPGKAGEGVKTLIESTSVLDRAKAIEMIYSLAESAEAVVHKHYPLMTTAKLVKILTKLSGSRHYCLNFYPHGTPSLNMTNFHGRDVIRLVGEIQQAYGVHIWYIP